MSDTPTRETITRELRKWARDHGWMERRTIDGRRFTFSRDEDIERALDDIADHIDEACAEKAEQRWRDGYDDGFASADDYWAHQDDETLAEHGLVRLPVDADGKTWHVGDVYTLKRDQSHEVCNVSWMTWDGDRWEVDGEAVVRLVRYRPTPAERIRKILDNLDYDNTVKEQPEPLLTIEERDELYSIANELEGDE